MPKVQVYLNERSGSGTSRSALDQALRAAGLTATLTTLTRHSQAPSDEDTILVAVGGDGTVNAVANLAAGHRLAVIPGGTLNHFARDLNLPADPNAAAEVIARGHTLAIDAGEVNHRLFVNNSSIGFYPGMVLQRERLRKVGWNKWVSLLIASVRAFLRFRHISVCVTLADGRKLQRITPFVFVGNNEYVMDGIEAGSRKRLDGARLYLYMAPGATRVSLLRLTLAVLMRRTAHDPCFESLCVEQFTVETRRNRRMPVALDGEVVRLRGPLHYRIRPAALTVLVPE